MSGIIKIATHNGAFHIDEIMAYAMLNYLYPDNELIRTRDPVVISGADFVIDVGQVYDPTRHRFDHHQAGFSETFCEQTQEVILSSAGLIYKHYGSVILQKFALKHNYKTTISKAYRDLYLRGIIEIDAHDNGIRQYSDNFYTQISKKDIQQRFYKNYDLGHIISKLNHINTSNHELQLQAFYQGVKLVWQFMEINFHDYFRKQQQLDSDYKIIDQAYQNQLHSQILIVSVDCNSWRQAVSRYEHNHPEAPKIQFIIYPQQDREVQTWRVRTITDQEFENRLDLLTHQELSKKVKNPEEIIFVHKNKFIASAQTLDTAIEIAIMSLSIID